MSFKLFWLRKVGTTDAMMRRCATERIAQVMKWSLGWRLGASLLAGFLALVLAPGAAAAPVSVEGATRQMPLGAQAEYWRDASAEASFAEARQIAMQGGFQTRKGNRPSFGYTADAVWLRVSLQSRLAAPSHWLLELMTARMDEVDWFCEREDGRIEHRAAGNLRARNHDTPDSRYPALELGLAPDETVTIYVRVHSETAVNLPLRLWAPEAYEAHAKRLEWAKGIFFGYLGALLLFGLAFAVVTRERSFVFFLVVVATLQTTFLAQGGYPIWLGWPQAILWTREGILWSMLLALSGAGLCLRRFFSIDAQRHPRLNRLLLASICAPAGVVAWSWIDSLRGALVLTSYLQLGAAVLLVWITLLFRNRKVKGYPFFVVTWTLTMLFNGLFVLQLQGWIPMWMEWELAFQGIICFGATSFLGVLSEQVREIRQEQKQALERAFQAERAVTQRLEQEVRERTRDLQLAKERAEEANRFKSLFLANISHEIRAPLSTVIGLAQAMCLQGEKHRLPPDFLRVLDQIRSGGEYLNQILLNLLDVSAAEAGRMPLHWSLVDLVQWQDMMRNLLAPIAESRDVGLRWQAEFSGHGLFESDSVRLSQILLNLVHNALKFTPKGRAVEVRLAAQADGLTLVVSDEGPGIPVEDRARIFEPFHQLPGRTRAADRGVGLGLAVVRLNVELLGGRATIENAAEGGACFRIHLPPRPEPSEG